MSWGYQGSVDLGRYTRNVKIMLARGKFSHSKTNTYGEFVGKGSVCRSFRAQHIWADGVFKFYHYGKCVLELDTKTKRVTDHAWGSYSPTTRGNIMQWFRVVLRSVYNDSEAPTYVFYRWLEWTNPPPRWLTYEYQMLFRVFRDGAPWIEQGEGRTYWLNLENYVANSDSMVSAFWTSVRALRKGERHWFTYEWSDKGEWVKTYVDDNAKKRHEAYLKRKQRQAEKANKK